jgi:DNA polymerase-3 subunit delta
VSPVRLRLVRGDDPSLVAQAAATAIASLLGGDDPRLVVEEHSMESAVTDDAASDPVGPVLEACTTAPFLTTQRVVVLRGVGRLRAEDTERLVRVLDHMDPSVALVLVAGGGALSPKLVAAARTLGEVLDASVQGRDRIGWITQRAQSGPVRLDAKATALVEAHLGSDLARLAGLLESLAAAYGEGARLGPAEVAPFLGESGGAMPWDLTDAIDKADIPAALTALHRLLSAGQRHPLVVVSILQRHYASMLRLDGAGVTTDAEAATMLGVRSAWSAGKSLAGSRRLGSEGIARALRLLAQADLDLKGATGLPPAVILEVVVARLAQRRRA